MRMADDETCAQACGALAQLDGEISAFSSIEFVNGAMPEVSHQLLPYVNWLAWLAKIHEAV